jgi:hypothetical protein
MQRMVELIPKIYYTSCTFYASKYAMNNQHAEPGIFYNFSLWCWAIQAQVW